MIVLRVLSYSLSSSLFLVISLLIRRVSSIILPNQSVVALSLDSLMLLVEHIRLQTQHPRYAYQSREEEYDLHETLARV